MFSRLLRVASGVVPLCALSAIACTSGSAVDYSQIEVAPATRTVEIDTATVDVDTTKTLTYTVSNTGKGSRLCMSDLQLAYTALTAEETADPEGPAFRLITPVPTAAAPVCIAAKGEGDTPAAEQLVIKVAFKRYDDKEARSAKLTIVNDNSKDPSLRQYTIDFTTKACNPSLDVPDTVDFGSVNKDHPTVQKEVDITNTGSCKLVCDWFMIEGDQNFTLTIDGADYTSDKNKGEVSFASPTTVDSNSSISWKATFSAKTGDPATATLTIHCNDANAPAGRAVKLVANSSGPRITVTPSPVDFGGKLIGKAGKIDVTINSVGTGSLTVSDISLKDTGETHFTPDFSKLQYTNGKAPSASLPLIIPANGSEVFQIQYLPTVKNPIDPVTGQVQKDANTIVITNDSFDSPLEVSTTGFGVEVECPIPVIMTEEGEEVQPQTVLHLHGDQSQPASGTIQTYNWTVTQPPDNKFNLVPSATFPNPTHEMNIAGEYTYSLDVCDATYCSNDAKCNTTAYKKVTVIPNQAIHVELTWDTPGDLNQTDEGPDAGADMDLHFTHPFATGPDLDGDGKPDGWFDIPYDCFWFNPHPDWESMNPNAHDDPSLDRDDTDGWGPENLNLDAPVNGRIYHVGVHFWDDHGYGFSYARIKIFIWGQLVFDRNLKDLGQKMFTCDMWEAATIEWPTGAVKQVQKDDGSLKITHNYANPAFVQIGGGNCKTQ